MSWCWLIISSTSTIPVSGAHRRRHQRPHPGNRKGTGPPVIPPSAESAPPPPPYRRPYQQRVSQRQHRGEMPPRRAVEEKAKQRCDHPVIKMNSSSPTLKLPAAAIGIRLNPPPAASGLNQPQTHAQAADRAAHKHPFYFRRHESAGNISRYAAPTN